MEGISSVNPRSIDPSMYAGAKDVGASDAVKYGIVDVMSGAVTARAGFNVTQRNFDMGPGAISCINVGDLLPDQVEDLEALLAVFGLDCENAKNATLVSVLQSIAKAIKQQDVKVTEGKMHAISDYDVQRLENLKKAMEGSNDANAKKVIENIDRMMQLKNEIEDLSAKGMVYDIPEGTTSHDKINKDGANFQLNTRIWEMGDRIADIAHYIGKMSSDTCDSLLNKLGGTNKDAVKDLLSTYNKAHRDCGWKNVLIAYAAMAKDTLISMTKVLQSPYVKFPPQINKDAFDQAMKEIMEKLGPNSTTEEVLEALEKKIEEILAQLDEVAVEMPPVTA